jgi:hypothetical protein
VRPNWLIWQLLAFGASMALIGSVILKERYEQRAFKILAMKKTPDHESGGRVNGETPLTITTSRSVSTARF